jgi:hypothetical protein
MSPHHPILCRYCGAPFLDADGIPFTRLSPVPTCQRCNELDRPIFTTQRGDGILSFHEILIRQNAGEPRRKLVETTTLHFIVFLDDRNEITGFELSDRNDLHILTWKKGRTASYFGVNNVGTGYANRDEIVANGVFPQQEVLEEFLRCASNLTDDVRRTLEEGLRSYRPVTG